MGEPLGLLDADEGNCLVTKTFKHIHNYVSNLRRMLLVGQNRDVVRPWNNYGPAVCGGIQPVPLLALSL